ncbi:MAG: RodZ domain-containing protein [Limnohabitans sp.]
MTAARKEWTQEHQHQLKGARLQAGVSDVAFARDNAIALRHLQQLEEGGSSAFYSESIKYDMGAKLLKRLGVEPHVAKAVDTVPDLSKAGPDQTAATVDTASSVVPPEPLATLPGPAAVAQKTSHSRLSTIVLSLVGVGLIMAGISLIPSIHPPGATQGVVQVSATAPPLTEAMPAPRGTESGAAVQEDRVGQAASADKSAATPAGTATSSAALVPPSSPELCNTNGAAQTIVPSQPSKAADYVYVTAVSDVSVCVRDAAGQVTRKSLQAGQSVNIPGQQPFEVTGENLNQLRVFFQGQRIWFQAEATRLRLTAATASD